MKGMAYTPFAVLAVSAMFFLMVMPLETSPELTQYNQKSLEAYNLYHESVEHAYAERLEISLEEYVEAVNETLGEDDREIDPEELQAPDYVVGTFESVEVVNYSIDDWVSGIEEVDEASVREVELDQFSPVFSYDEGTEILEVSLTLRYNTSYSSLSIARSFEEDASATVSLEEYENFE